jgi:hypothetical protein
LRFATHAITEVAAGEAIAFLESDRPDGPRVGDVHSDRAQPSDASVLACGEQADAQGAGLGHFCNHPGPDTRIARYPVILLLLRAIEHGKRTRRIGNPVGDEAATCREATNGLVDRGRQLQSRRPGRQPLAESLLIRFGVRARLPRKPGRSAMSSRCSCREISGSRASGGRFGCRPGCQLASRLSSASKSWSGSMPIDA